MTLVIYESSAAVRTYWALSNYEEVDAAIENLQKRERAPTKKQIQCLLSSGQMHEGDVAKLSNCHSVFRLDNLLLSLLRIEQVR